MNRVFLIGNLCADPTLSETNSGVSLCRFSIAVNRNYGGTDGEKKTDFFNCIAWRGLGENVARYAKKGNKVAVTGSIELRNYEDSEGVKKTAVDIVAQEVEFLTPKQSDDYDDVRHDIPRGQRRSQTEPQQQSVFGNSNRRASLQPFDDDSDIPF